MARNLSYNAKRGAERNPASASSALVMYGSGLPLYEMNRARNLGLFWSFRGLGSGEGIERDSRIQPVYASV